MKEHYSSVFSCRHEILHLAASVCPSIHWSIYLSSTFLNCKRVFPYCSCSTITYVLICIQPCVFITIMMNGNAIVLRIVRKKIQRGILLTGETHKYLQQVCVIAVCFASPIALPNRKCVLQIYSCIENKGTTNCSDGTINCADGTINCASGINNCSTGTNICADGTRNLIKG